MVGTSAIYISRIMTYTKETFLNRVNLYALGHISITNMRGKLLRSYVKYTSLYYEYGIHL